MPMQLATQEWYLLEDELTGDNITETPSMGVAASICKHPQTLDKHMQAL
jgi:hypothetical protein